MATKTWTGTGTWSSSNGANWSGGTAPVNGDVIVFDGTSGTGTATADSSISGMSFVSITCGAYGGTLDMTNGGTPINLTFTTGATAIIGTGTGARTLKFGSGTFTMSNGGGIDFTSITGLTNPTTVFNAATLVFSAPSFNGGQLLIGGGLTYGTITVNGRSAGNPFTIQGSNTIATLNVNGPCIFSVGSGLTQTISSLNITGSSSGLVMMTNFINNQQTTLNVTSSSIMWAAFHGTIFGTSAVNPTNSFDLGGTNFNGGAVSPPSAGGGHFMIGG